VNEANLDQLTYEQLRERLSARLKKDDGRDRPNLKAVRFLESLAKQSGKTVVHLGYQTIRIPRDDVDAAV
jgi:hypothetical protein